MKYRTLGNTGVQVSEVGLGTWQLGSADWGVVDEDDALAILHKSCDLGVNFFDTADVYGNGRSERVIGRFLRETRQPVYVATKLGRKGDDQGNWPPDFTLDYVRRHTQQSLKNLGVESLFLTQWHCIPTQAMRDGEVFDHLRTIQKQGLIQHWAVSVESVEEGLICLEQPDLTSMQVIYNIFRQKLTDELLPHAKAKGVGILARVPLASGLLSGRFTSDTTFGENDHRRYNRGGKVFNAGETFAGVPYEKGVRFAQEIKAMLNPTGGVTMAQLALRWVLDHEQVTSVIPGATRLSQAASNAAVSDLPPLSAEVHDRLRAYYAEHVEPTIVGAY